MFYQFDQNNSYGVFIVDDYVCHRLIIEAVSEFEAISKAEEIGCYWNGVSIGLDCPCCGDRWYCMPDKITDDKLRSFGNIEAYAQYLADNYAWTAPDIRIYYEDGRVTEIYSEKAQAF